MSRVNRRVEKLAVYVPGRHGTHVEDLLAACTSWSNFVNCRPPSSTPKTDAKSSGLGITPP